MGFNTDELIEGVINWLVQLIVDIGPIGLYFAMVIQAFISPIPSEFLIGLAGASFVAKYGFFLGITLAVIFSSLGSLTAALLCFKIVRKGGRPLIVKFLDRNLLKIVDDWCDRNGFWSVLITRFIIFLPFDTVSYAYGLTEVKLKDFMLASTIAVIPRAIFFSLIGYYFHGEISKAPTFGLGFLFLVVIIFILAYLILVRKFAKKKLIYKTCEDLDGESEPRNIG